MRHKSEETIPETTVVVVSKDQTSTGMRGETVILNVETGRYYGMDNVGSRVWQLIQEPKTVKEIHQVLLEDYEVDSGQCKHDLITLLRKLSAAGLIELRDEAT